MFGDFWAMLEHRHFLRQTTVTNFWAIFEKMGYISFCHLVTFARFTFKKRARLNCTEAVCISNSISLSLSPSVCLSLNRALWKKEMTACIGPSGKLLCSAQTQNIYAANGWQCDKHVWLLGRSSCSYPHAPWFSYELSLSLTHRVLFHCPAYTFTSLSLSHAVFSLVSNIMFLKLATPCFVCTPIHSYTLSSLY